MQRDIPYVFSQQKAKMPDRSNVLPMARGGGLKLGAAGEKSRDTAGGTLHDDQAPVDGAFELKQRVSRSSHAESGSAHPANKRYRYVFAALLIAALGLWFFAWGPFAPNRTKGPQRADSKKVAAESGDRESQSILWGVASVPAGYAGSAAAAPRSAPAAEAAAHQPPTSTQEVAAAQQPPAAPAEPVESVETTAAPQPPAAANHPPTVSISGPTQVTARQAATYTASGSDPDGDGITYSWGGSSTTRCWSTPGLYTVSVTVTDSRGQSSGASVSVRVI
jgi:PKD domain